MRELKISGFTLIELMITVAILGILVSLVAPKYQQYVSKSRKSEAKIALAGLYAAEKGFYSEYSAYVPSLDAIAFMPEGNRQFYRVGFGSVGGGYGHQITGYVGDLTTTQRYGPVNSPFTNCILDANGIPSATDPPFDVDNPQSFTAGAAGYLSASGNCDVWMITDTKLLKNITVGY